MIHLPFEDRIIFIGGRWVGEKPELIKNHMRRFQFTPDPDGLKFQYRKLLECSHDGFGCIATASMRLGQYNMFTADWVAGGTLNYGVCEEKFSDYEYRAGKLQSIYSLYTGETPKYFAFMTGTGNYIGDLEDCFGSIDAFKELIVNHKNAEITERLITMLKSGGATEEYIELDDLIL